MSHGFLAFSYVLFVPFRGHLSFEIEIGFQLGYTPKPSC